MGSDKLRRSILAAISAADLGFKLADFLATAGGAKADAWVLVDFGWTLLKVVELLSVVLTVDSPYHLRSTYFIRINSFNLTMSLPLGI